MSLCPVTLCKACLEEGVRQETAFACEDCGAGICLPKHAQLRGQHLDYCPKCAVVYREAGLL